MCVAIAIDEAACLTEARFVPSPNCDERPAGCEPELIVVHAISLPPGRFGGPSIGRLFCNRLDPDADEYFADIACLRVSAHLLIRRDGALTQYVPFDRRAWHAGESSYKGRAACNDFSVGIELEGDDHTRFNAVQYRRLAAVCKALQQRYPAIGDNIAGHSDIAPGRKTDPGPHFDWDEFGRLMRASQ